MVLSKSLDSVSYLEVIKVSSIDFVQVLVKAQRKPSESSFYSK